MAKKITFPKEFFPRWEEQDFSDDGVRFKMYRYKNLIPISYTRSDGYVYCSIRMDYLLNYSEYYTEPNKPDFDKYNYVLPEKFNLTDFMDLSEQAYRFYLDFMSVPKQLERAYRKLKGIDGNIKRLNDERDTVMSNIATLEMGVK